MGGSCSGKHYKFLPSTCVRRYVVAKRRSHVLPGEFTKLNCIGGLLMQCVSKRGTFAVP